MKIGPQPNCNYKERPGKQLNAKNPPSIGNQPQNNNKSGPGGQPLTSNPEVIKRINEIIFENLNRSNPY